MNKLIMASHVMHEAHKGQTRWDNITPYSTHPIKVVEILQGMGVTDEDMLITGYLHDVLEDTDYSVEKLIHKFGGAVFHMIEDLTFEQGRDDTYYWDKCSKMRPIVAIIKIADILANISDNDVSPHFIQKRTKALSLLMRPILRNTLKDI